MTILTESYFIFNVNRTIMKQPIHIILIGVLLCTFLPLRLSAQPAKGEAPARDSLRISLLTCAAGEEIYTLFGHTAIRCENLTRKTDVVYNYGVFDFSSGGFVLRFALGETDYRLDKGHTDYFAHAYYYYGRDIWQQVLNLTQEEKERLIALLEENYRPENRVYRYNFFYDNCSTRPRDKVEEAVEGSVDYGVDMEAPTTHTFRELVYRYSEGHPWSRLAMDLCLGSEADKPISRRTMQFVPFLLQADLTKAQVVDSIGQKRRLVSHESQLVKAMPKDKSREGGLTPELCAWLCFAVTLLLTVYGLRRRKPLWGVDVVLFAAMGLAGCVLAFLVFFSQHPCMSPNYLLFVFHPLHLFGLAEVVYKERRGKLSFYQTTNLAVLTLFILLWGVFPQEFPLTVLPLALCLWIRSVAHLVEVRRSKK